MEKPRTEPIRQAIASGEFQRATVLWNEYIARIRAEIDRGICTSSRMAEAGELVEWSRTVMLCDRAHAQEELNSLWVASRYGDPDGPPVSYYRASL